MGFRLYISYVILILGSVPASGHRDTEDGDDVDDDDVGDNADEVTMVQRQTEAQRVVTMVSMVTMTLSATTLTRSRWCRIIDKVGLDPLIQ